MIQKNTAWKWKRIKINLSRPGKKNFKKEIVWDLRDNIKHPHTIGVPKQEERVIGWESEEIKETFPKLEKETDVQVQEAQKVPNKIKPPKMHTKTPYNWIAKTKTKES